MSLYFIDKIPVARIDHQAKIMRLLSEGKKLYESDADIRERIDKTKELFELIILK